MRFRKLLLGLLCVSLVLAMAGCGGSKSSGGAKKEAKKETKKEEKKEDVPEEIVITGPEWESGDLQLNVPDGWEVAEDNNDWVTNEMVKVLESENIENEAEIGDEYGTVYGDVYADISLSDFSDINSAYSKDACDNYAAEYKDKKAIPKEIFFNDNCYLGYRNYGFVGDAAKDWAYLAYTSDGRLIEIRAYTEGGKGTEKNKEAFKSLLASIRVGGKPLSPIK